ncbi:MAG: hypothetical protein WAM14_11575 [Candidatus Nitrosopolaris sp.]
MSINEKKFFIAATVYARKIKESSKLYTYDTHRMKMAKLDTGFIIIEKEWTVKKPWPETNGT